MERPSDGRSMGLLSARGTACWVGAMAVGALLPTLSPLSGAAADPVSAPASSWDFNGDGRAELAISAPRHRVRGARWAGSVTTFPTSKRGVQLRGVRRWTLESPGVPGRRLANAMFGARRVSADFDGDGHADLAIARAAAASAPVVVLYGTPDGLSSRRSVRLPRRPTPRAWGGSLAAGDLNGDGFGDLVVTRTYDPVLRAPSKGSVVVIPGSARGLRYRRRVVITDGIPGPDHFGRSIAVGNLNGDRREDLVVATTEGGQSGTLAPGSIHAFLGGGPWLVRPRSRRVFDQDRGDFDLPDVTYGYLGVDGMWIGDLDGDGFGELFVADENGDPPGGPACVLATCPGLMLMLTSDRRGLTTVGRRILWVGQPRFPQRGYVDGFETVAVGDLDRDGFPDLATTAARTVVRSSGATARASDVVVLYGSRRGLGAKRVQVWNPARPGVPGAARGNLDGNLTIVNLGWGRADDLVIDDPTAKVHGRVEAGAVTVLYGTRAGLRARHAQRLTQDSPGVPGVAQTGALFSVMVTPPSHSRSGR